MMNASEYEAGTLQGRIRMLPLFAVVVFVVGMAVLAIKEGELGALAITLGFGFAFAEFIRRKGMLVWNWAPEKTLGRIRMAKTPEMAWKEICRSLTSLHFDFARLRIQIEGEEEEFSWSRGEQDRRLARFMVQVSLPVDHLGLGAGELVVGKDISQEPLTEEANDWLKRLGGS